MTLSCNIATREVEAGGTPVQGPLRQLCETVAQQQQGAGAEDAAQFLKYT